MSVTRKPRPSRPARNPICQEGSPSVPEVAARALVEVLVNRQELSMPPTITLEQMKGFSFFMLRAVLSAAATKS
jgi:hypothetical protein